jgi:N-acetylated-alpha-linked acidic dipeptidase
VFTATMDPRFPTVPPSKEAVPPFLNFAPLDNALAALDHTAQLYDQALAKASENGASALARENARAILREANSRLIAVERTLTSNEGLPNRPWYKHEIYAPGFYTGYGVKTLPGVRESIEQKQWKQADEQIALVGKVLENAGEAIQGAAAELTKAAHN